MTQNKTETSKNEDKIDYSQKESSTLDRYEVPDALKDVFLPEIGILDLGKDYSVHITDNYDYTKIWTSMEVKNFNPFRFSLGTLANDFGTITSKLDAINPYEVDIYFTIRR
jgi:metal-sulfur cluster biosynthetic enzyme